MNDLNFSYNWNGKLFADCFTTIRLTNKFQLDEEVFIKLNDKIIDTGKVIQKIETKIDKLTELVCRLDTGYSKSITIGIIKKMYPNVNDWKSQKIYLYLITRKYEEKKINQTENLINLRCAELSKNRLTKEQKELMKEDINVAETNKMFGLDDSNY